MKVLVVSGFLGAGKTTFIKELIRRTGKFMVVLENEYGDNNLDSQALNGSGDIEILEFMEGCVCCTKKDSFVNTILSISAAMDPEYLVVEPTGVGKLSAILENINKISYERISVLPPVVILNPASISDYIRDYPEIYKDQISNASKIVLSKCEHTDADIIEDAVHRLREYNSAAEILNHHYSDEPDEWWNGLLDASDGPSESKGESSETTDDSEIDEFGQISLKDVELGSLADLIVFLEDLLRGSFGQIPRAKGIVKIKNTGEYLRFDVADGLYGIIKEPNEDPSPQCVFIGKHIQSDLIGIRTGKFRLKLGL